MLTKKVLQYQETKTGWDGVYHDICLIIYQYPTKLSIRNSEICADFLLFCHPFIKKYVTNYAYNTVPFEVYLKKCLHWRYISFMQSLNSQKVDEELMISSNFMERQGSELPTFHTDCICENIQSLNQHKQLATKHILIALIKNYPCLNSQIIKKFYESKQFSHINIDLYLKKAAEICQKKQERYNWFYERRNLLYYEIQKLEKDIDRCIEIKKLDTMKYRLSSKKIRLKNLNKEIQSIKITLSNKEVSQILSIPKGTVDSAIYRIKHYMEERDDHGYCLG